jgi:hypothetical protein
MAIGAAMRLTTLRNLVGMNPYVLVFPAKAGIYSPIGTGFRRYDNELKAGDTLENAQAPAAHESPRTNKLYDRAGDEIKLDEIERITI